MPKSNDKFKIISVVEDGVVFTGMFNKEFVSDRYQLLFNTNTGVELLRGINGHKDPFMTDLPTLLDIGVMGHCKNKCSFCYQGDKKEPHMTLENFKRIIDETKHHVNQVALGGRGDPNLHPKFKQMVEYARKNGVVPNYTTSGNGLKPKHVEISKLCGAVAVSDYRQPFTFKALEMFTDAKIKTNLHFVFSRASAADAQKILYGYNPWRIITSHGIQYEFDIEKLNGVVFLLFKPQGRGKQCKDLIPKPTQLKEFAELVASPQCKIKVGMDSCLVNHVIRYVDLSKVQRISLDTCEAARMSTYITPDMRMVPCSFADHDQMGVSLKGMTIADAWKKGLSYHWFRDKLKNPCCPALEK